VFLNSPTHTIEKYACVEKIYLFGLQISYAYENSYCNHDIMIDNGTSHYIERGEYAIDCHDNSNDPLYVKIYPMMLFSNDNLQWHTFFIVIS
jgi:hypothetical protein